MISVIIPAWNEEDYLPKLLDSLQKQEFEDFETIVVDNNSTDQTIETAKQYDVRVYREERQGPGHARNRGAQYAKGEVLLFLDADVVLPSKNILQKVSEAISQEEIVAGTGTWKPNDGTRLQRLITKASSKIIYLLYHSKILTVASGAFLFIEKNVFHQINGFNGDLPFNEDHDIIRKAKSVGNIEFMPNICNISTRRLQSRGILGTTLDYGIPSLLYLLKMEKTLESRKFKPGRPVKN